MNIFQLMKLVLDESFAKIPGANDAERTAAVKAKLVGLSKAYEKLAEGAASPSYKDAATRTGYVARYVTSHACLVADVITGEKGARSLFKGARAQVACIGGGPGSDFLGILKYMMRRESTTTLKCYLLDREEAWGDSWSDVDEKLEGATFKVSTHFQGLDVGKPETWAVQSKYLTSDLFTLSYFVSEVWAIRAKAEKYFAHLFTNAKSGAYFLYIDNNSSTFSTWIDTLAANHGLDTLVEYSENARIPGDEQKADLEPYLSMFGPPKLTANVAVRIYRKP